MNVIQIGHAKLIVEGFAKHGAYDKIDKLIEQLRKVGVVEEIVNDIEYAKILPMIAKKI